MSDISCMSFNILACDTHDAGYELPEKRISYVIETIRDQLPDLIGVQEACDQACAPSEKRDARCGKFNWCEEMLSAVPPLGYTALPIRAQKGFERDKQNIGCGLIIYFKSERFEILSDGCECYAHNPVRYFQWVKLKDKEFDREILFTNTHFSINQKVGETKSALAGDGYRIVQAVKLANFWFKNCDEKTALFATGDYNSQPHSNAQAMLRSLRFQPSQLLAERSDEYATMNFAKTGTYILDYCYVNPTAQDVREYKVVRTHFYVTESDLRRYPKAGYASDHRAIMTYCNYKPLEEE